MSLPNRYPGTCIRCGDRVDAGAGVFTYGDAHNPYPWTQHRFQRNLPMVEHKDCHETWKDTSRHHLYDPEGTTRRYG